MSFFHASLQCTFSSSTECLESEVNLLVIASVLMLIFLFSSLPLSLSSLVVSSHFCPPRLFVALFLTLVSYLSLSLPASYSVPPTLSLPLSPLCLSLSLSFPLFFGRCHSFCGAV